MTLIQNWGKIGNLQPSALVGLKSKHNTPKVKILNIPDREIRATSYFQIHRKDKRKLDSESVIKRKLVFFFTCSLS